MSQAGERQLLEIVLALRLTPRLAGRLHGRQQQRDQDADDRNHHQQFDQRKSSPRRPLTGVRKDAMQHGDFILQRKVIAEKADYRRLCFSMTATIGWHVPEPRRRAWGFAAPPRPSLTLRDVPHGRIT